LAGKRGNVVRDAGMGGEEVFSRQKETTTPDISQKRRKINMSIRVRCP